MGPPVHSIARRPRLSRIAVPAVLAVAMSARAAVVVRADPPSPLLSVADRLHDSVAEVRHPVAEGSPILSTYGAATLLPDGMAITTLHAVGQGRWSLTLAGASGSETTAQVVGTFPAYGLAVLRLDHALPVQVPTEYTDPTPGEQVIVLGSGDDSVTIMGVTVLGANGDVFKIASAKMVDSRFWGGPLLDASGRLVGICLPSLTDPVAVDATTLKAMVGRFLSSR